jgi:hypothetical protein
VSIVSFWPFAVEISGKGLNKINWKNDQLRIKV